MNKLLVTLVVPCIEKKFNVLIPDFLTVKEVIALLVEAVMDATQNMYVSSGSEVLCRSDPEMVLKSDATLSSYQVAQGESLYLF
jgi:uncharacterized ubiquitin-like protein YukD